EAPSRRDGEARDLRWPVRGGAEGLPRVREVRVRVGEPRRATSVRGRDAELPGPARRRDVDARAVVAVVRQLVLEAHVGRLVRIRCGLTGGVEVLVGSDLVRRAIVRWTDHDVDSGGVVVE